MELKSEEKPETMFNVINEKIKKAKRLKQIEKKWKKPFVSC